MHVERILFAAVYFATIAGVTAGMAAENIKLANDYVDYTISPEGKNLGFIDKRSGKDYRAQPGRRPVIMVKKGNARHSPVACALRDGRIHAEFKNPDLTVVLKVTCKKHYFVFEVESISDPGVESVTLTNLRVTSCNHSSSMSGVAWDDDFAACVRALNLQVQVSVGGKPAALHARCYREHGIVGAKVALAGCPRGEVLAVLKEVIRGEGLPYSPLGGPWALEAEENRGSYMGTYVSEKNVDEAIALAKRAGMTHIHLRRWWHSLGHYQPRKDCFPGGMDGFKAVVDKIHAAGLKVGLHTLTGAIDPHDSWVTPVPHKHLAADGTYTLAQAIDEKADAAMTVEQPGDFDTVWVYSYSGGGNVIRIDDELIQYEGLSRDAPYGFTRCKRGAFGTKVGPHAKGAAVKHLFVRYSWFQPDPDSPLVDQVADSIARVFNACKFDMIYMDGAEGMSGGWYGMAKMRRAIFERLEGRVLVEASSWGHQSWPFHSRVGAWDSPCRGAKRFLDAHCRAAGKYRDDYLLPAQLGWWAICGSHPYQYRSEMPEEMQYLCTKMLGLDMPMSFGIIRPGDKPPNARRDEYLTMLGRYERLRRAGYFSEAVKEQLRKERAEFRLVRSVDGAWQLLPTDYHEHKVTGLPSGPSTWTVENRFGPQPVKLRIEALYSVDPYDSDEAVVLADFAEQGEFAEQADAKGVTHELKPSADNVKIGKISGRYSATNAGKSRDGAWAKAGKVFSPPVNLGKCSAIGVWIHGDGKGELLNIQLDNPRPYPAVRAEHYVDIDFTGWRYFELLFRERDAQRCDDYRWPYGTNGIYRRWLRRGCISPLNLYYNNLPPQQPVTCFLSPIKALRTRKVKLVNPSIEIGGRRIVFPVALESGSYIELESVSNCSLFSVKGERLEQLSPRGAVPELAAGANRVKFACEGPKDVRARAQITFIRHGEPHEISH